jgi:hypothetical protein
MVVGSLEELQHHARKLIDTINATHNGGARFLAHPLRMLRDLDIELSPEALNQLLKLEPSVAGGSDVAYEALMEAEEESNVRVVISEGLFRIGL